MQDFHVYYLFLPLFPRDRAQSKSQELNPKAAPLFHSVFLFMTKMLPLFYFFFLFLDVIFSAYFVKIQAFGCWNP